MKVYSVQCFRGQHNHPPDLTANEVEGAISNIGTVELGYMAHIAIERTFAIRRMPSSCQNLYKPLLTGAV